MLGKNPQYNLRQKRENMENLGNLKFCFHTNYDSGNSHSVIFIPIWGLNDLYCCFLSPAPKELNERSFERKCIFYLSTTNHIFEQIYIFIFSRALFTAAKRICLLNSTRVRISYVCLWSWWIMLSNSSTFPVKLIFVFTFSLFKYANLITLFI